MAGTRSADVAVIGAGPAGLVAALRLAQAGRRVVVLEQADRVGGMAGSFEVGGVRVDFGSHRLHPAVDAEHLALLRHLLGDQLQTRPRLGRIWLAGRWLAFPLRSMDLVRHLPPAFALGAARDTALSPFRRPRDDTFAEVVRAGLGPAVASTFYDPYVEKLWGVPTDELSGELARRRVSASSARDVLARLWPRRRSRQRSFLYPATGFGAISERLAEAAVAAGGEVRLNDGVAAVAVRSQGATVTTTSGLEIDVARVWSTAPLGVLAGLVTPPPPAQVIESARRLRHRGLVLVYLVVDRPRWTGFDAHYFPEADVALARLSEPKNYREGPDPEDRTVLCAEVPATVGDALWQTGPEALGEMVRDVLVRLGLPDPAPSAVEVRRLPRVYPVYRPGFERALAGLETWAAGQERLLTFGRQGLFVPDNTHHALAMGTAAADALRPDGSFDDPAWRRARDGFRAHVVED